MANGVRTYKNRPEASPETKVWRYMSLWDAVYQIQQQKLRLTLVDYLREVFDPFEGSVPQADIDAQIVLFSNRLRTQDHRVKAELGPTVLPYGQKQLDPYERARLLRLAKLRSAHVSCWSMGDESEAMWRLYCDDGRRGRGVAFQSSLGKLEASVGAPGIVVSPIRYIAYRGNASRHFDDEVDAFMHKRTGFANEKELRLLHFDADHFQQEVAAINPVQAAPAHIRPPDLDRVVFIGWQSQSAIDRVVISPYSDDQYEQTARQALQWAAISASVSIAVELSELHTKSDSPRF